MISIVQSHITCKKCGKKDNLENYAHIDPVTSLMVKEGLCYDCAYWINLLSNPPKDVVIIDHKLYRIEFYHNVYNYRTITRKGMRLFINLETKEAVCSDDYTLCAEIPERFHSKFKNQYKEIDPVSYSRIIRRDYPYCTRKGCFDRYHCMWYNKEEAEPNGSWNKIPGKYVVGSEDCESFVDKSILNDNNT